MCIIVHASRADPLIHQWIFLPFLEILMTQDLPNPDLSAQLSHEVRMFAAGLAHAMANVVGSLQMNAELSRMYAKRNDLERAMLPLERLAQDCTRANKVIADLQRLAGSLSNTKVVRMPLVSVVNMALDAARAKVDSSAEPVVDLRSSGEPAEIDANGHLILIELMRNALNSGANTVVVTTQVTSSEANISVEDDGLGIDAETCKRIFEPFFTTRREHGNSGLGLTISKHLSSRLGGSLDMPAIPGKGVKIILTLPRLDAPT
ncbi:HAMP domain-containing histidine kinase [Pseudolysobacter antarcticus]|uniref:histidine kinase n=1 Tax=Pseudolysobacter antarcticus TaxID=2511995 RepID=A0A411HJN5_9GAMM|nr:HAMP domain-containing sensor histidine kinase [Pseudolysobacter antarcticus]QBB70610.1 HAMP domain-containing histidine kinase [Pseudolysobacter antarcticus]